MELSLCALGWAADLLYASEMQPNVSRGYVSDLRHIFLRRWEYELEMAGVPITPTHPKLLSRAKAIIEDIAPIALSNGDVLDASFCFGYGYEDESAGSINYRNPNLQTGKPRHFLDPVHPLCLGNFAVGVQLPSGELRVLPPPDVSVAGVALVATAKHSSVLMWLGVRYVHDEVGGWLEDALQSIDMPDSLFKQRSLTYAYGTVFSQRFAGDSYDLTTEQERELRERLGYPKSGPIRERMLYDSVVEIFGRDLVVRRYRGRELERLEIDIWVPSKRLGFEYQGQQHFSPIPHWHGVDGFEGQLQRDAKKRRLCKTLGILLIFFGPADDLSRDAVVGRLRASRVL